MVWPSCLYETYDLYQSLNESFSARSDASVTTVSRLVPGMRVCHPTERDWGVGQVQSVIGNRVTVNFENAGKVLINIDVIELVPLDDLKSGF